MATYILVSAKRGIFVAPFDELVDPGQLAELAGLAERGGWDGIFLWDHVNYRAPVRAVADPWIALAAIAYATERLRLGPMVTPLSRRRVQKVARETVTLDRLSRGRLTLGVGLGSDRNGELEPFGEVVDPRERARLLDERLERLGAFWSGEFQPPPVQRPRIPSGLPVDGRTDARFGVPPPGTASSRSTSLARRSWPRSRTGSVRFAAVGTHSTSSSKLLPAKRPPRGRRQAPPGF